MSAHDSILAAWVKQIHDANRKQQEVLFKEGDFIYLSTINISFPEGLALKLIHKYIGPYKILEDFNNQSFRIDSPSHLKQRGVYDVFHSSLLKLHIPNDDQLFPGCMNTQWGVGPESDNEWVVKIIISHARSAVFKVLWKAGDVTWLPYYQIVHLQALDAYFDLLGVEFIKKLPSGKGKPPHNDAQVLLGAIGMKKILSSEFKFLSFHINTNSFFNLFSSFFPCIPSKIHIDNQPIINHTSSSINKDFIFHWQWLSYWYHHAFTRCLALEFWAC